MNTIKLSEVKISEEFLSCNPRMKKFEKVTDFITKHNKIDKPLVLKNGVLVDNYIRYLAAKNYGLQKVPYVELNEMTYVVGRFPNSEKPYIWKNDKGLNINIDDNVIVRNNFKKGGKSIKNVCVKVVGIFPSSDLGLYNKHKSVVKKLNN